MGKIVKLLSLYINKIKVRGYKDMKKIDEIYMFINQNSEWNKETIIKKVLQKFNISQATAQAYYYMWKKEYMKGANCVPKGNSKIKQEQKQKAGPKDGKLKEKNKEVINDGLKIKEGIIIKGKYGTYIKEKNKVTVGDVTFKSVEDVEEYKKKEITLFYKRLAEVIDVMKL